MSNRVSLNGTYTWSKMIEENGGDNIIGGNNTTNPLITEVDRVVQRSLFESDRRHRVTISGVYLLPFGRDGKFLADAGPVLNAVVGGWEMAGMWLFNTGRPWGMPQNVIYDGNAKIEDVDYNDPRVIRAVRPCVAQMNDAGVVGPMQNFSIAAGCTAPNFIIKPSYTGAYVPFRERRHYAAAVLPVRHELRQVVPLHQHHAAAGAHGAVQHPESGDLRRAAIREQPDERAVRHDRQIGDQAVELPAVRAARNQADLLMTACSGSGVWSSNRAPPPRPCPRMRRYPGCRTGPRAFVGRHRATAPAAPLQTRHS